MSLEIIIGVSAGIGAILLIVFVIAIVRKVRGSYVYNYEAEYDEDVDLTEEELALKAEQDEDAIIYDVDKARDREMTDEFEGEYRAKGVDALQGKIDGPWKSVIASLISANRGVSRDHLGYAPVTQILNEVSPENKNVAVNLDKDQLDDLLAYVKVLESSAVEAKKTRHDVTPQQKYRMLQRAFEDKRDLDTTKEAREFSREVIRQEKLDSHKLLADEQLLKLDQEVSSRVEHILHEDPAARQDLAEFKDDLKGRGLSRRKQRKQKRRA